MKSSIKAIFGRTVFFLSLITVLSALAVFFMIEQANSFKKVDILNTQKEIVNSMKNISKSDIEMALIQFNGKSTELLFQIQQLYSLHEYDLVGKYILFNSDEYKYDLKTLEESIKTYNKSAYLYFQSDSENEAKTKEIFENIFKSINEQITNIILTNIKYDKAKLEFMYKASLTLLGMMIILTFLTHRRFKNVYKDILFLQSPSADIKTYKIYSTEADAIFLKMNRKNIKQPTVNEIDPVTGICNNKGLANSYADKKGLKESNFTAMAIIEVDNFSKTHKQHFTQEFIQNVLRKITSIISMYEQAADVIARTDYNQFTIILSRQSKEKAYKEIDQIRQSISELKFTTASKENITITVSGGFYIKPGNVSLNNAILETKSILEFAKQKNGNKISQKKDVTGVKI